MNIIDWKRICEVEKRKGIKGLLNLEKMLVIT